MCKASKVTRTRYARAPTASGANIPNLMRSSGSVTLQLRFGPKVPGRKALLHHSRRLSCIGTLLHSGRHSRPPSRKGGASAHLAGRRMTSSPPTSFPPSHSHPLFPLFPNEAQLISALVRKFGFARHPTGSAIKSHIAGPPSDLDFAKSLRREKFAHINIIVPRSGNRGGGYAAPDATFGTGYDDHDILIF